MIALAPPPAVVQMQPQAIASIRPAARAGRIGPERLELVAGTVSRPDRSPCCAARCPGHQR
jgi:hypothetical protein